MKIYVIAAVILMHFSAAINGEETPARVKGVLGIINATAAESGARVSGDIINSVQSLDFDALELLAILSFNIYVYPYAGSDDDLKWLSLYSAAINRIGKETKNAKDAILTLRSIKRKLHLDGGESLIIEGLIERLEKQMKQGTDM